MQLRPDVQVRKVKKDCNKAAHRLSQLATKDGVCGLRVVRVPTGREIRSKNNANMNLLNLPQQTPDYPAVEKEERTRLP